MVRKMTPAPGKSGQSGKQAGGGFQRRMSLSAANMQQVTGEDGDVTRDEEVAYGVSTLTFKDVSFSVKDKEGNERMILSPVSGHFEPGTLVAVMGPSGCGKSTLVDILANKKTAKYEGTVLLNGRPRDHLFRRITSYVPQEDVMPPHATVKEAVMFAHRLKNNLPEGMDAKMPVGEILKDTGLLHVQDTKIGGSTIRGVSGGQKRRVSLAKGYCAGAQILFADEPTSGLSSSDAESCVKTMRYISHKFGMTIIVVIHQPRIEVARLFDHLVLLTANPGRPVYNGRMKEAAAYWEKVGFPLPPSINPTDFFLDVVTPELPGSQVNKFVEHFEKSAATDIAKLVEEKMGLQGLSALEVLGKKRERLLQFGNLPEVRTSVYEVGFLKQLRLVFGRKLRLSLRDKEVVATAYIAAIFKSIVIGIAFLDIGNKSPAHQLGYTYFLTICVALAGLDAMPKQIEDRAIMKYETSEGFYHEAAFIFSASVINSLIGFGSNVVFVVGMFFFSAMDWALLPVTLLWCSMMFVVFDGLFSLVTAVAKDAQSAAIVAMPALLTFLVFNGYTVTKTTAWEMMAWIIWISPPAHAIQGMALALQEHAQGALRLEWQAVNELYGYEDQMVFSVVVYASYTVVFRIGQAFCLKKLNNIQK